MIDLHCHILPGIDDGAPDLEAALQMARCAVDNGTEYLVATPHIHRGRYENTAQTISSAWDELVEAVDQSGLPLRLSWAAELRLDPEIMAMVDSEDMPWLGEYQGNKVFLLEFPHSHIPPGSERLTRWLIDQNITPMIAHPERNKDIIRDLDKVNPYVEQGCLLQVTAGSVAGLFGPQAQQRAEQLIEKQWVTILASDGHNLNHRPPELQAGFNAAKILMDEQYAIQLCKTTPSEIAKYHFPEL